MSIVSIDTRDSTPIYAQIDRGVRAAIAAGRLRPGDLVTSRIDLAAAGPALAAMGERPPTGIMVAIP